MKDEYAYEQECSIKRDRYGEFTGPRRLCTNEIHFQNGTLKDTQDSNAPYATVVYWSDRCTKIMDAAKKNKKMTKKTQRSQKKCDKKHAIKGMY